jgi:hypothetical protein
MKPRQRLLADNRECKENMMNDILFEYKTSHIPDDQFQNSFTNVRST